MGDILVGVDSSAGAERALDRALFEGQRSDTPVRVLHVWQAPVWVSGALGYVPDYDVLSSGIGSDHDARALAEDLVAKARTRLVSDAPVVVTVHVQQGAPGRVLADAAEGARQLVVGGRGHGLLVSALLGSTTASVLHHAPCPVTVVPEHGGPPTPYRKVVVGLDGSPGSQRALRYAYDVARREKCPLVGAHAWMLSTLPSATALFDGPQIVDFEQAAHRWLTAEVNAVLGTQQEVPVECTVVEGGASASLLDLAEADDLLVLGSRGQGGFAGLHLGSVSSQCTRHATGVVTVVRTP